MSDRSMAEPIGEIVETSSTQFLAQACELDQGPGFGSLVRVECDGVDLFGLVYEVRTGGVDPGSQAVLRGRSGLRDGAIYRENPDLAAVLRTSFAALIVGHCVGRELRHYLPPRPPRLHWSVYACSDDERASFSAQLSYLGTLLAAPGIPADELVAAHLRLTARARSFESSFALRAGRELARLLPDDYRRLGAILRRLEQ